MKIEYTSQTIIEYTVHSRIHVRILQYKKKCEIIVIVKDKFLIRFYTMILYYWDGTVLTSRDFKCLLHDFGQTLYIYIFTYSILYYYYILCILYTYIIYSIGLFLTIGLDALHIYSMCIK